MVKRYEQVEYAILTLVIKHGDHQGYAPTLPTLAGILRQSIPDIADREIVDTIKRLSPRYLTLSKYSRAHHRLVRYPEEIGDDSVFFYQADFCMQRTPHTDPYVQTLAQEIDPPEASMAPPLDEESRKRLYSRLETMGFDRVKHDLLEHMGRREVGGAPDVREAAWDWVRQKEAEAATGAKQTTPGVELPLIAVSRLDDLRKLSSGQFDLKKLVRLCEEINIVYAKDCYFATAMLTRSVLDHVPPLFGFNTFAEVASNYGGGGKSFKEAMQHLENASRRVADAHLHLPIRSRESLPNAQQVNCGQQLDVLLAEIVRTMK